MSSLLNLKLSAEEFRNKLDQLRVLEFLSIKSIQLLKLLKKNVDAYHESFVTKPNLRFIAQLLLLKKVNITYICNICTVLIYV